MFTILLITRKRPTRVSVNVLKRLHKFRYMNLMEYFKALNLLKIISIKTQK